MIERIYSNLGTFKEIQFNPGLNILLADKTKDSSQKQTRNGAGKSSLIEIIHFLLGSDAPKDSIFKTEHLIPYTFGMNFRLNNTRIKVERSGGTPNKVFVAHSGNKLLLETIGKESGQIPNRSWKKILGKLIFGIDYDDKEIGKYGVTFRSAISYFIRRQSDGGFFEATRYSTKQQIGNSQVTLSFLLGLDWHIPQKWDLVREKEKTLKELKKITKNGSFGSFFSSSAEIRTKLTVLEEKIKRLQDNLRNFVIHPEYRELEQEATVIAKKISKLNNENLIDREFLDDLEKSMKNEKYVSDIDLEQLYNEVGIVLPDLVTKRFEDVRQFHDSIIKNRISYLQDEITQIKQNLKQREENISKLSQRQAEIMAILNSHGALDQYTQIQSELTRTESEYENLKRQLQNLEQLENIKTELEIEKNNLFILLKRDHQEQNDNIKKAILAFEHASSSLYESAGQLTIDYSTNGPQFEVTIQGKRSKGITNMQIFCFDMMLMEMCSYLDRGPKFLVHDSHLFDGVDSRQIANALAYGAKQAEKLGFQYIVTMNSDVVSNFPVDFEIGKYILPIKLTDATEEGGLFGFKF